MKKISSFLLLTSISHLTVALSVPSPQLGGAYSHDKGQALPITCLNNGPITYSGNNSGVTESEVRYDLASVKRQLDLMADIHVDLGIFDLDSKTEFVEYLQNDNLSLSLIYRTKLDFKDANYNIPTKGEVLNTIGKQWAKDPDNFRAYCGDAYVAQMHHGAYLYVAFQMSFTREEDRKRFEEQLSGSFASIVDFHTALTTQSDKLNIEGNVHVVAYQVGGYPQRLSQIFNTTDYNKPSNLTQCALTDIHQCSNVLAGIIKYITTDFPNQVKIDTNHPIPEMAAQTGVETNDYKAIIPDNGQSVLTPEIIVARDKLGKLLATQQAYYQRAQYLKTLIKYPFVYDKTQSQLNHVSDDAAFNVSLIKSAGLSCFNDLKMCLSRSDYAQANLRNIDEKALVLPNKFEITETDSDGKLLNQQLFVDSQQGDEFNLRFLGIQTSPSIAGNYDINITFEDSEVYITKRDHLTHQIIAQYQGTLSGQNMYEGRVNYTGSQTSNPWKGTYTQYQVDQMRLKK